MDKKKLVPVVTAREMARLERVAVEGGGSSEAFMREAGKKVAERVRMRVGPGRILVLAGKGNKGGDGYVAGRWLLKWGYQVEVLGLFAQGECSELNQMMAREFFEAGGVEVERVSWDGVICILDALLGTGFSGEVGGEIGKVIGEANESGKPIVAIDLPSGLDGGSGVGRGAIRAAETVCLGLPKMGCFLRDGWNCVGRFALEDFGMLVEDVERIESMAWIPLWKEWKMPMKERSLHKYQRGFVVGFGGSEALKGAVKLSGLAALHSGAGIVKLFYMEEIGPVANELIAQEWEKKSWDEAVEKAQCVFVGPGMGRSEGARKWMKEQLPLLDKPCVIDADALFFLGGVKSWPKRCVLTPHRGEMMRLLHVSAEGEPEEFLARCQRFVDAKGVVLVLKGAPTFVLSPNEKPVIVPKGDPGMATAGSGDVLTGVIASLIAQGVEWDEAAVLGVSIHAVAGEAAAKEKTSFGYSASDLIEFLPEGIRFFLEE